MMEMFENIFHLPDLQFCQYCERRFSLNKGIYNTIDNWFYTKGLLNIIERRKTVVQFMFYCNSKTGSLKFGPGGLSKKLELFWKNLSIGVEAKSPIPRLELMK